MKFKIKYSANNFLFKVLILFGLLGGTSCGDFLEEKSFKYLVVPNSLEDLQALLNTRMYLNSQNTALPEVLADNYYITTETWLSINDVHGKPFYTWASDSQPKQPWTNIYQSMIYYPNVVLDALIDIKRNKASETQYNTIKGQALFYRSFGFYTLAQLYCQPYSGSANTDLGLPLRTTAAIETPSVRASVQETYDRIITDLNMALELLPSTTTLPTQPNKAAAYGLLARCYLSMRDYVNAGIYADLCLTQYNTLMDYNTIPVTNAPFRRFNPETIYYSLCNITLSIIQTPRAIIDTLLYDSYHDQDLRKDLFFKANTGANASTYGFRGGYDGDYYPDEVFNGIATDEIYLIRAECYARNQDKELALTDLNALMKMRWKNTVPYPVIIASSAEEALEKILIERRKELVYRGIRWSDIRRFNVEGRNITLERNVNGQKYTLPPGDLRWVLLIPDDAINRSTMQQNPRD